MTIIPTKRLCGKLGKDRTTLHRWEKKYGFPKKKICGGYDESEIDQWLRTVRRFHRHRSKFERYAQDLAAGRDVVFSEEDAFLDQVRRDVDTLLHVLDLREDEEAYREAIRYGREAAHDLRLLLAEDGSGAFDRVADFLARHAPLFTASQKTKLIKLLADGVTVQ